jgi:hypothetical protein
MPMPIIFTPLLSPAAGFRRCTPLLRHHAADTPISCRRRCLTFHAAID